MLRSAIRGLRSARKGPITVAAFFEQKVQIWNWETGDCEREFDTVLDGPPYRLTLNALGDYLVAGNWRKGKLGGVACYDIRTGEIVWHRFDIRQTQGVKFGAHDASVWCELDSGPAQKLSARSGDTLLTLRDVRKLFESLTQING